MNLALKVIRFLLPLAIIVGAVVAMRHLIGSKEDQPRRPAHAPTAHVDATRLKSQDFNVVVNTRGTVRPRTQSVLMPEVSGRIVSVSPRFREGEFIEPGDELLRIDDVDYKTAAVVAEAELVQARLRLAEEKARGAQAARDWAKLGDGEEAGELVLRKPQFAQALAAVGAAEARLEQARRDLGRTRLRAPYAGQVLSQAVDVGQYVAPGTVLGEVYAVDYAEVRLPLSDDQHAFLDLPERYRNEGEAPAVGPAVVLRATYAGRLHAWTGRVVRTEGAVDVRSRQRFVVAQVDDPYRRIAAGRPPLKVGMFVEAEIAGRTLADVIVIPRKSLREGREVLVVSEDSRVHRRPVEIAWSDAESAVVGSGLVAGEVITVTPLPYAIEGMPV